MASYPGTVALWLTGANAMKREQEIRIPLSGMEKAPKSKAEIESLLVADLRGYDGCEHALRILILPIRGAGAAANWTVSCFDAGCSDSDACDRALQHIVPRLQRIYELVQKH